MGRNGNRRKLTVDRWEFRSKDETCGKKAYPGIQRTVKYAAEKKKSYGRCCAPDLY
jgi:hypothetical protein